MHVFENLGQALWQLRTRKRLGQQELADKAGLSRSLLSAYENEKAWPSVESVEKLLKALEADRFDLINALQAVHGEPQLTFRQIPEGQSTPNELTDLLGLDLSPEVEELLLHNVGALRDLFLVSKGSEPVPTESDSEAT